MSGQVIGFIVTGLTLSAASISRKEQTRGDPGRRVTGPQKAGGRSTEENAT
jgi:hypothetical protein